MQWLPQKIMIRISKNQCNMLFASYLACIGSKTSIADWWYGGSGGSGGGGSGSGGGGGKFPSTMLQGGWREHGAHHTLPKAKLVISTDGMTVLVTQKPGACAWKQSQGEDALCPSVIEYSVAAWQSSFWCRPCLCRQGVWMPPHLLQRSCRGKIWYQLRGA